LIPSEQHSFSHQQTIENTMSNETEECCKSESACCGANTLALVYGSLLARVWLGVRALQTGIEKFAGSKASEKVINIDGAPNDYGLSAGDSIKEKFQEEPMMLKFALPLYDKLLGPALLLLGLAILLGFAYRTSLFVLGLLYISLTWGLILIKQDDGVSWLGVHMILIVAALALAQHNRFSVLKKW